ncbi:MAG: hypothetical protein IKP64_02820 [Selenomonadaceae bacterium]|nr:hypothetical protein [Selenomonadaceae bacterium]
MKIFRLVVASLFLAALMISSSVSAVDRNYFNGDKTYVSYGGVGMGALGFIDRSTLTVEKYEPPIYIISVDTFLWNPDFEKGKSVNDLRHKGHCRFKYDYANRKMYIYAPKGVQGYKSRYENHYKTMKIQADTTIDWSGDWAYIDPHVFYGEGSQPVKAGETAFALAYKLKFYGLKGYNGADFYEAVRGVVGEVKDSI